MNVPPLRTSPNGAATARPSKLLERLRQMLRDRPYAPVQTEIEGCVRWVELFVRYHERRHPRELGPDHVAAFLANLRKDPDTTAQREAGARAALRFL